jgi:hypothetical protein
VLRERALDRCPHYCDDIKASAPLVAHEILQAIHLQLHRAMVGHIIKTEVVVASSIMRLIFYLQRQIKNPLSRFSGKIKTYHHRNQGVFLFMNVDISKAPIRIASLALNKSVCPDLNEQETEEMLTQFWRTLKTNIAGLNEAFTAKDWEKSYFFAENLFGATFYFNTTRLNLLLKDVTGAAAKQTLTQDMMDQLNQEVDTLVKLNIE